MTKLTIKLTSELRPSKDAFTNVTISEKRDEHGLWTVTMIRNDGNQAENPEIWRKLFKKQQEHCRKNNMEIVSIMLNDKITVIGY